MIINGDALLKAAPIWGMQAFKSKHQGVTHGLSEAGYDIRIKQDIVFHQDWLFRQVVDRTEWTRNGIDMLKQDRFRGRFVLASSLEKFKVPTHLMGVVHDKSSWARHGLSVFNTVLEPGWEGYLTLELVYHGKDDLIIPHSSGIAQVVFHQVTAPARYSGRYQNQANEPVPPIKANSDEQLALSI